MKWKRLLLVSVMLFCTSSAFGLSGAIFTTLEDGSAVNHNIYEDAQDVYLDGGPGQNAPAWAAGLPEGWYYYQITDPPGKKLLSTESVKCRCFHVNGYHVIDYVCSAEIEGKGKKEPVSCEHQTGIDQDHEELGAITVQLYPFNETPNNGGVYKVWATPVECFQGDPEKVDNPGQFHGFIPSCSKTDVFKVNKGKPCDPGIINIVKIDDSNANGIKDEGEEEINGWPMLVIDPLGVENIVYTPATIIAAPEGTWTICENVLADWKIIGDECQEVEVAEGCIGEEYNVAFYNIQLGSITVCKGYDVDADGCDDGIPVEGFAICIYRTDAAENCIDECGYTDCDGCVTFDNLLPGNYTVCEIMPDGWYASAPDCVSVSLEENEDETVQFLNYCKGTMYPRTKGFWQNQGCTIVDQDDLNYLAGLAPYMTGTVNTTGQDNCGGVHCPDSVSLPLSSVNELGCYIVAPNSQDDRLGLAQQLMAFILNCRHGLDSFDASLILPYNTIYNAQDLIDDAINAWETGQDVAFYQDLLDSINNMEDGIDYTSGQPCPVVY
jgi:hypothetical protein